MSLTPPAVTCLPAEFRLTMAHFPTGVALLTSGDITQGHAMTVNSFTSVSLVPPIVLVCVTPNSRITGCIAATGRFGISVLSASHNEVAAYFADRRRPPGLPRTETTRFRSGNSTGVPLLEDALAQLECTVADELEVGDHLVYLAHVVAAERRVTTEPIVFFNGTFTSVNLDPLVSGQHPPAQPSPDPGRR